ncbi:MAG: lysylphosphatidylglycerol synthase transmembrane domain-containing protein [bacterium]|nr:lysylphosphatidylglycerol synthase transmembrane domain-containing protein [bacterium]
MVHRFSKWAGAGIISLVENNGESKAKEVSLARAFFNWKTLAAVIVAGVIVYAFFHGFKREDLEMLAGHIQRMNLVAFAFGFLTYYMAYFFLGLRYKLLLENSGAKISLWQGIITCFMGAATNAAVPAKVGDLYRAYLLNKHSNIPVGQGLGANMGERILDLAFVFGIFFVMSRLLFAQGSSVLVSRLIESGSYLLGAAILVLILLLVPSTRNLTLAIFPGRARDFAKKFTEGVTGSLHRNWHWLIASSAGLWAMESLRLYFVTKALGVEMTVPQIIFTVMATTLLASIPVSFSGLGLVEGGITELLKIFRLDAALGLAVIICDRLISFVSVVVLGFISFLFVKDAS